MQKNSFEFNDCNVWFVKSYNCSEYGSVIEVWSEERPKDCVFGATGQAAFDAGEMQRDASTCRARSRAAICNAANYITLVARS